MKDFVKVLDNRDYKEVDSDDGGEAEATMRATKTYGRGHAGGGGGAGHRNKRQRYDKRHMSSALTSEGLTAEHKKMGFIADRNLGTLATLL